METVRYFSMATSSMCLANRPSTQLWISKEQSPLCAAIKRVMPSRWLARNNAWRAFSFGRSSNFPNIMLNGCVSAITSHYLRFLVTRFAFLTVFLAVDATGAAPFLPACLARTIAINF
jgi:hypothetical protein